MRFKSELHPTTVSYRFPTVLLNPDSRWSVMCRLSRIRRSTCWMFTGITTVALEPPKSGSSKGCTAVFEMFHQCLTAAECPITVLCFKSSVAFITIRCPVHPVPLLLAILINHVLATTCELAINNRIHLPFTTACSTTMVGFPFYICKIKTPGLTSTPLVKLRML